jgi:PAS domain S-box-containing protein
MAKILPRSTNADNIHENERLKRLVGELTTALQNEQDERKFAEEAFKESEDRYRKVVDMLPEAVIIHQGGQIVFANVVALEVMGADSLDQLTQKSAIEFVHPDYRPKALKRIQQILSTGIASEFSEEKFITLRNEIIDVEVIGIPIQFLGRSAIQTIIRDITERKQAEEELKKSLSLLDATLESIHNGILVVNNEGNVIKASKRFADMWRIPEDILASGNDNALLNFILEQLADPDGFISQVSEVYHKPEVETIDLIHFKDGRIFERVSKPVYLAGIPKARVWSFLDITERKQAEKLLHESEYFFRESQRAAFVGSYKFDLRNDFWTSSLVLDQIFGIDKNYQRNLQGWLEIIHPDDRAMMTQYFNEDVIEKRQPFNKEYRIISQFEGEVRWVLGLGKLRFDDEGIITEMIGTIQDITERKLSQIALLRSEEKYSILFKDSPDAYLIITDGVFTDCNRATEVMLRGDRMQIIGMPPDVISPEFQPDGRKSSDSAAEKIDWAFQNGKNTFEWIHRRFDGTDLYVEVSIAPMTFQGKQTLFTTWRDITERKQAEKKLKESQQLFHELFNASPDAIVLIDPHHPTISWPIVDCNEAACRMNGFTREEMIGKSIDLLNLTKGTPNERLDYLNKLRQKAVLQTESIHHHKDGHVFPVEISTSVITIDGRELVLGIDRDITERKKAEEAVHKSEIGLKRAELASKSGNWEYYLGSQTIIISEGAAKIYGIVGDKFDPSFIKSIPNPEFRQVLDDALKNLIERDIPYDIEFKIKSIDTGDIKDIHSEAFFDKEKKIVFGIIQDITDRKKAEVELIKSEDRYRRFISQVSEGVYRFESDVPIDISLPLEEQIDFIYDHMFIAECNQAFRDMYGIESEKEMIGRSHIDFHGGRSNPLNRNALREFIQNGYRVENAITEETNRNGQLRYFSNNSLGLIENNQLVRIWGTQADITEKTKSDQVQQVLYTISNAAISTTDLVELVEIISIQLSKLLDASNFYIAFYDEASGTLSTLYNKDEIDQIDSWPAEKSLTGYVIKNQKSLLASKADILKLIEEGEVDLIGSLSEIWLGVPLILDKKAIGAIVVQSYDNPNAYTEKDQMMLEFISDQISISIERKKAETEIKDALAKAQESDRLKSAFLANMSHEIRTPLNAIIGFSELIRDPAFETEQQDEFAQLINDSGNNLLSILSDIMDISKIEAGQMDVIKRKISVNKLILSIQKEFIRKAEKKGIELRLEPANPIEEIMIESDETKLRQIIGNFLSNALKFTEDGFIELGIEPGRNFVQIYVKDTGIGIPKDYHDKIFERFRQVETSHTRKYGGNGLGLCISKNLVELLGGTIGMESEEGQGSTFYITIPII